MSEKIVDKWYDSIYEVAETAKEKGLVLCGDGKWGKYAVEIMSLFEVIPLCVCRMNPRDTINGSIKIPHLVIRDALNKYKGAIYISCADSNGGRDEWNRLLKKEGVLTKESGLLFWRYVFLLDTGLSIDNNDEMKENLIRSEQIDKLMLFNHMLHSGSAYFQQLIDSNNHILCIPTMGSAWLKIYDNRLRKISGKRLWMETCAQMAKYFDTSVDRADDFPENTTLHSQGGYYNKVGEFDWRILISPVRFFNHLKSELNEEKTYSFGEIIKAIFASYANSCGRSNTQKEYWIAYDLHDPETRLSMLEKYRFYNEFTRVTAFILIREPLQHLNSLMKSYVKNATDDMIRFSLNINRVKKYLKTECGEYLHDEGKHEAYVIRFEDLKHNYMGVMNMVATKMGIPLSEEVHNTTINGISMFFKKAVDDGFQYVAGHDSSAVGNTKYIEDFSEYDIERLRFLFSSFIKTYYDKPGLLIKEFTHEEMQEDYGFINLILSEIIRVGDLGGEAEALKKEVNELIDKELEKNRRGRDENYYPILQ